jgi:hypothetical protein
MRFSLLLAFCLFIAQAAFSQSVVGTYRLVSFESNYSDGTTTEPFGANPSGYVIVTPKRFKAALASSNRKAAAHVEDKAALLSALIAYTGTYTIEGNKIITGVDVSWNQAWTGTKQRRTFTVEGDRLTLVSDLAPSAFDPSKTVTARLVWQHVEYQVAQSIAN